MHIMHFHNTVPTANVAGFGQKSVQTLVAVGLPVKAFFFRSPIGQYGVMIGVISLPVIWTCL